MDNIDETPSDTHDDMSPESDFEELASKHHTGDHGARIPGNSVDYWFGAIYLRSVVAQKLLTQPNLQAAFPELDTKLDSELHRFPYMEKLSELWQEGIDTESDCDFDSEISTRVRYLKVIGSVMRCGDQEQRQVLLRTFQSYGVDGIMNLDSESDISVRTPTVDRKPELKTRSNIADNLFTTILFEHANEEGWSLQHDEKRVVNEAYAFKCVMHVNNDTFATRGRSKEDARHAASKKACERYGLV